MRAESSNTKQQPQHWQRVRRGASLCLLGVALTALLGPIWPSTAEAASTVTRISGADRFVVAATVARKGWDPAADKSWPGVKDVVVVCGEDAKQADALAASGLAGVYHSPLLLVRMTAVPTATKSLLGEIAAKNPGVRLHVIGGTASVPDQRVAELQAISGVSAERDRLGGADRYSVSAGIATRMVSVVGTGAIPGVLLMCSEDPAAFSDALAASPVSYAKHMPMLGVKKASVPAAVRTVLDGVLAGKPKFAVSSSAYISTAAASGATRLTTKFDRYNAAVQIANAAISRHWLGATQAGVACKVPDALAGGTLMGQRGGVLLFTDTSSKMLAPTRTWLVANQPVIANAWIFGGTASVSNLAAYDLNVVLGLARGPKVVAIAKQQLGKPYVWGAAGPNSFDCSGLAMYVYAKVGVSLPHHAASQAVIGTHVSRANLWPGDLVFFGAPVYHVGIYIGGGNMIDASSSNKKVVTRQVFSDFSGARRP